MKIKIAFAAKTMETTQLFLFIFSTRHLLTAADHIKVSVLGEAVKVYGRLGQVYNNSHLVITTTVLINQVITMSSQ